MDKSDVEQHLGDKITIIGSSGAGKTTLALQLGEILEIPVVHLDRHFWLPGWKDKPEKDRIKILKDFVQQKQWIIEGAYFRISEPRLEEADTIIFLDMATGLCLKRIFRRYFKDRKQPCLDLSDGCSRNLNLWRFLKVLKFQIRHHKELSQKLHNYSLDKKIIWFRSPEEVENFLAKLQQEADSKGDCHVLVSAIV